jgi:predicted flap endonuclease-1-like 5' DNA nuclease
MQSRADSVGTCLLDAQEQGRAHVLHIEELNDSLRALEARMARSGERHVELDHRVAELTEESQLQVEESAAGLAERDASIERFEQRLAQQTEMLAKGDQQVKNDCGRIESLQSEIEERTAATERSIRERDLEMDRLRRTLEARLQELQTSDQTVQRLEDEVTGLRAMLDEEPAQAMDEQAQLGARLSELQTAETTWARDHAMVESERTEKADLEASYERRLRERQLELDGIAGMLRDREAELAENLLQAEHAKANAEVAKARIARRNARIEALDAEMIRSDDTRERLLRELHERELEGRQMRSLLRVEPPTGDDLTAINGIGAKTAALLNSAGIFTYGQIASWDQSDVQWIEAREPRLVGRIRLERWAQGARRAALGEFGRGLGPTE